MHGSHAWDVSHALLNMHGIPNLSMHASAHAWVKWIWSCLPVNVQELGDLAEASHVSWVPGTPIRGHFWRVSYPDLFVSTVASSWLAANPRAITKVAKTDQNWPTSL